jgi:hypothetical protein
MKNKIGTHFSPELNTSYSYVKWATAYSTDYTLKSGLQIVNCPFLFSYQTDPWPHPRSNQKLLFARQDVILYSLPQQ